MARRGDCLMGVTLAGAIQAVALAARQGLRWAVNHLHWRVLRWWGHRNREMVGLGQGPLQPDGMVSAVLGKRVQRDVGPLHPRGLAPKRMRDEITDQDDRGKHQQKRRGRGQGGAESIRNKAMASGACQGSVWILVVQC